MLHNEHVYKYRRWQGWVAKFRTGRLVRAAFMYQWAADERAHQQGFEV